MQSNMRLHKVRALTSLSMLTNSFPIVSYSEKRFSSAMTMYARKHTVSDLSVKVTPLIATQSEILLCLLVKNLNVPAYLVCLERFHKGHGEV